MRQRVFQLISTLSDLIYCTFERNDWSLSTSARDCMAGGGHRRFVCRLIIMAMERACSQLQFIRTEEMQHHRIGKWLLIFRELCMLMSTHRSSPTPPLPFTPAKCRKPSFAGSTDSLRLIRINLRPFVFAPYLPLLQTFNRDLFQLI